MELTHYERFTKSLFRYDKLGRNMARKIVAGGKPAEDFFSYVQGLKNKLAPKVKITELIELNNKAMITCHHITQELLRAQEDPYSFSVLTKHPDYATIVGLASATQDEVTVNSSGNMHFHLAAHDMAGLRVYAPSKGLAEQLRHTELRGLTVDDLKLPFRSIYLKAPESADLRIWNDDSQWHKVIGIYMTEELDGGARSWRFLVCGEPKPIEYARGVTDDNDALVYFNVPLPTGMDLKDSLATTHETVIKDVEELRKRGKDSFGPMLDEWQDIFRWAMNVVLYMTLESAELETFIANKEARQVVERIKKLDPKSKKRRNLQGRLGSMRQCRRVLLGKSVTAQRGSWELTVRVRVKGHMRNQPYGPGRMYRRLQWIEPYWKGPEDGALAGAATEVASPSQRTRGAHESRNRKSPATFERVASIPTEGVDGGDYHLVRGSEATGGTPSSRLRDRRGASGDSSSDG